jgi:hypothetical protein
MATAEYYKIACQPNKAPMAGETLKVGRRKNVPTRAHGVITGKVNGITVVDLDCYKWVENDCIAAVHPWIAKFGDDYIDKFNTHTVRTVSGGIHLYFKYEPDLKNCVGDECKIDIRNDNGYVIGAGSFIDVSKGGIQRRGTYTTIRRNPVAEMPEELKYWLFEHVNARVRAPDDDPITPDLTYDISARDCYEIAHAILAKDPKYFDNSTTWRDFTVFTAHIAKNAGESVWESFSRLCLEKYDESKNRRILKKCKEIPNYAIKRVLRIAGMSDRLPYYQYKKWNERQYATDIAELTKKGVIYEPRAQVIDRRQLGDHFFDDFLTNKSIVVKSDMGTGKSHSFIRFIKNNHHKYISITPRALLANSQYNAATAVINEQEDLPQLYTLTPELDNNRSLVIQLDSLMLINNWDFSEHILFLDEISSTIDYLINSNTPSMQRARKRVMWIFLKMLKECATIIAVDADVDYATHLLFQRLGIEYDYIENKHKHCEGIRAFEFESMDEFYNHVSPLPAYIIPTDSKLQAEKIHGDLTARIPKDPATGEPMYKIACYTSDWRGDVDMTVARIIFSPKITVGLDSCWGDGGRGVYACYVGKTINPMHYMQQCNRERNMTELGYIFVNKFAQHYQDKTTKEWHLIRSAITCNPRFENPACADAYCKFVNSWDLLDIAEHHDGAMWDLYTELYSLYLYRDDALGSNKFWHFKRILRERGYIEDARDYKHSKNEVATAKSVRELRIANFKPDALTQHHGEIQEYLKITDQLLPYYREYFINDIKLTNHRNIICMFEYDIEKLRNLNEATDDFKFHIIKNSKTQLLLIHDLITTVCDGNYDGEYINLNQPNAELAPQFMQTIKAAYGLKLAKQTFDSTTDVYNLLMKMSRRMFGNGFMKSDRVMVDGVRVRKYWFNADMIDAERTLYAYRRPTDDMGYDDM